MDGFVSGMLLLWLVVIFIGCVVGVVKCIMLCGDSCNTDEDITNENNASHNPIIRRMSSRLRAAHRQPPPSYVTAGNYPPVVHPSSPQCRQSDPRRYGRPIQFSPTTGTYAPSSTSSGYPPMHYHPDMSMSSDRSGAPSYGHPESPPPTYEDIVKVQPPYGTGTPV